VRLETASVSQVISRSSVGGLWSVRRFKPLRKFARLNTGVLVLAGLFGYELIQLEAGNFT